MTPIFAVAHYIAGTVAIFVLGGVGAFIAHQKCRSVVEGIVLGLCLGPLGWIIEALLPTKGIR